MTLTDAELAVATTMARQAARRFAWSPWYDDLVQAGLEAACRAAERYEDRGRSLEHLLSIRVRGAVTDEWRRLCGSRRDEEPPLSLERAADDGYDPPSSIDVAEHVATADLLAYLLGHLDPRDRHVLVSRAAGRDGAAIGADLGVCSARVTQLAQRAERRARELVA